MGAAIVTQEVSNPEHKLATGQGQPEDFDRFEESGVSAERIIATLRETWSERRLLCQFACVGLALSIAIAFLIPARYGSSAQLMPPDSESNSTLALVAGLSAGQGGMGALAGDLLGIKSTGALFVGVLGSRTVQDRIVQRFDLKKEYRVGLEQAARQRLAENTSVSEDRKSGIISLSVTDRDPKRAAAIAGAYVEELNTLMAQLTTSSARREREFLEQRLNAVKQDLDSAEKDFSQFASKNGTIDITEQGKAMVGSAATLEGQLIAAQAEVEGLKQIYSDNNVRVRTVQARINELRRQLEEMSGKAVAPSSSDETASGSLYPSIRELPILGVPYADLYRRLKIEEAVYETLTKQYELAKVEEAKEIPTVKVLDLPEVPEKKSYPPRLFIMIAGTLGSLALGIVWVVGRSRWQEINSQDPAKLFLGEIFHGVGARIPWLPTSGNRVNERGE
jgi:capsule polysaccharide export protein KpsE/RkpR